MSNKSKIGWTDDSENPVHLVKEDGSHGGHWCRKHSPGCAHCYSETANQSGYFSWASHRPFTGEAPPLESWKLDRKKLEDWKRSKPRKVFVGSMTDLFGDWVPREWQHEILDAAAASPQTTILLTKRPEIMYGAIASWVQQNSRLFPENIWVGCSVENQRCADERRAHLLAASRICPVTWVSYEPALELVDWTGWEFIRWHVMGGESGNKAIARRSDLQWYRQAIAWDLANGIEPFMKQLGCNPVENGMTYKASRGKGDVMSEWPKDLQIQNWPGGVPCVAS